MYTCIRSISKRFETDTIIRIPIKCRLIYTDRRIKEILKTI